MRHITISFPLHLISHQPGSLFPFPGTSIQVRCYPTKVIIFNLSNLENHEFSIPLSGPVKQFTAELNLEESFIKIHGHYEEGYAVFFIKHEEGSLHFYQKKGPLSSFSHLVPCDTYFHEEQLSQIYLGVDKTSDIQKMRMRKDPKEIIPYLYRLSSFYSHNPSSSVETHPLLKKWDETLDKREILPLIEKIYLALFSDGFAPRLIDDEHQGIVESFEGSPIEIFSFLYPRIRRLFISYEKGDLFLLPFVPPSFTIGRITKESFPGFTVSFLWKGGEIKRCVIQAHQKIEIALHAPHSKKFRYHGKTFSAGEKISLEKGLHFFDRFTK